MTKMFTKEELQGLLNLLVQPDRLKLDGSEAVQVANLQLKIDGLIQTYPEPKKRSRRKTST